MPLVYVTYRDPRTDSVHTAPVETPLSFRVFRASLLVEGVELPGGRSAALPGAILWVSLDPPPPAPAGAPAAAVDRDRLEADKVLHDAILARTIAHDGTRNKTPQPQPPAGAIAEGGAAAHRKGRR